MTSTPDSDIDAKLGWVQRILQWATRESLSAYVVEGVLPASSTVPWLQKALLERLRLGLGVTGPEQADLLVVVGDISHKFAPVVQDIWARMSAPSWVLHLGVLPTTSSSPVSYALVDSLHEVVPVTVRIEGLPPSKDALERGLQALRVRMREAS